MTAATDRHAPHIWCQDARGIFRCAFQECQAEPSPEDAAWVIAGDDARIRSRIVIDH
jgi:hypothetical protein